MRRMFLFVWLAAVPAGAVTLGFSSLPSAQGWVYQSGQGLVETAVASVDGTTLTLDTMGTGIASAGCFQSGIIPLTPFSVELRARVQQDEGPGGIPKGFGFTAFTGTEAFGIVLDSNSISVLGGPDTAFNGSVFNTFRMDVTPSVGYELFVNNALFATGLGVANSAGNSFIFGDGNGVDVANATTEIQFLRVREPAGSVLMACAGVLLVAAEFRTPF